MAVDPPPRWTPDTSVFTESALWRIVILGENGVNEEVLNSLLSELASLASAGQESWNNFPMDGNTAAVDAQYNALEKLRTATNDLTRILVDTLTVENIPDAQSYTFRFGQVVAPSHLQDLRGRVNLLRDGLSSMEFREHYQIMEYGASTIEDWESSVFPRLYSELRSDVLDKPTQFRADVSEFLRAKIADAQLKNISRIEQSAAATLSHIDTAAGKIGSKTLAMGFASQRDKEATRARWWTFGVVVCVVVGIALPASILTFDRFVFTELDGATGMVIKALTGLPVFALAAYFGRISSLHRETERYLRILSVQVDSVQAYADVLPEHERAPLILSLGHRAFADPGFATKDTGKVGAWPDEVTELLKKAMELAKDGTKRPQ